MKKEKLTFRPDLQKYANFSMPIVKGGLTATQKLMDVLYDWEKSCDDYEVSKLEVEMRDGALRRALLYSPNTRDCKEHEALETSAEVCEDPKQSVSAADCENLPCIIFFHGGGFVYQAAPHHFRMARGFVRLTGFKLIFFDYRLAPDYLFPYAANDGFDAYLWVRKHSEELGIDPEKIIVAGDSAGGTISAVCCLLAKEDGIPLPLGQVLLYPSAGRRTDTESMRRFTDTPILCSADIKKYFEIYLGKGKSLDTLDESELFLAAPVEAGDLSGLPSAYIEVAEYDCLRDEGVLFAKKLEEAGVTVELTEVAAAMHGYDYAWKSGLVKELMKKRAAFCLKLVRATV